MVRPYSSGVEDLDRDPPALMHTVLHVQICAVMQPSRTVWNSTMWVDADLYQVWIHEIPSREDLYTCSSTHIHKRADNCSSMSLQVCLEPHR